jgi:hypothetical protein
MVIDIAVILAFFRFLPPSLPPLPELLAVVDRGSDVYISMRSSELPRPNRHDQHHAQKRYLAVDR